jgi:hypothetical protein
MIVQVVRTPPDLERTLEANACRVNHWIDRPAVHESEIIEQILGQAFSERGRGGQAVLVDPLHAIGAPLHRLNERGLQLVAVVSRGLYTLPSWGGFLRQIDFELADYLVAPDPCYFRPASAAFAAPIHTLGSQCAAGHALIVGGTRVGQRQKLFQIWTLRGLLIRDFEGSVPWCAFCRPDVTPRVG